MKMKYDEIGQADNPGGMGGLPGVPVQPTDKLAAVDKAINQKVEAMNGRYPWKNGSPVVNVPAAGATGYSTSEGVPIESSFRYADDFYNQMGINNILDNTPSGAMSYQGYLAYNGITDPRTNYVMALDRANEMYARSLGTYGASGESLAQGNLVGTGYSEYLNGLAYQNKANMYIAAQQQLSADQRQTAAQYQQYLRDYEKENGISVPGAAQGGTPGGVSVESSTTVLTPEQQTAYNYITENVQTLADIPAAVIAMRSQGLTDAAIEAALNNWKAWYAEKINQGINTGTALASGYASQLKEAYGEGEEYSAALAKLQDKNAKLVDTILKGIENVDLSSSDVTAATAALRETTKGEDGTYGWDSMTDGDRAVAVRDYLTELYKSGDISQETYNNAMSRYYKFRIQNDIDRKLDENKPKDAVKEAAEQIVKLKNTEGAVTDEQYQDILDDASSRIKIEYSPSGFLRGAHVNVTVDGEKALVLNRYTGSKGLGSATNVYTKTNEKPDKLTIEKSGDTWAITTPGGEVFTLSKQQLDKAGYTEHQTEALMEIIANGLNK